jgi:hypothetical protein
MKLLRSFVAVVAGLVTIVALSTATDLALEGAGLVPPPEEQPGKPEYFYFFAAYRFLYTVAGAMLTARLAPSAPIRHGLILGAVGTALGALGAAVMWGKGPDWYALSLPLTAIPLCWIGAKLAARR